jgi:hypothetical protein
MTRCGGLEYSKNFNADKKGMKWDAHRCAVLLNRSEFGPKPLVPDGMFLDDTEVARTVPFV